VEDLPMAPSCTLDADGLRAQLGRYRTVGRGAVLVEQTPRRLVVEVGRTVDAHLIRRGSGGGRRAS
jgi:hypothetical protein